MSDTGICGLRVPQDVLKQGYITEDGLYGNLSKFTDNRPLNYNSVSSS